jgi:ABC-type glycerol-3-phosphate transport system permease component
VKREFIESKLLYMLLGLFSLFFLFPIYWALMTSFKGSSQIMKIPPEFIPSKFSLDNYIELFQQNPMGTYFFNSLLVSLITTIGSVLIAAFAGYGFSKYKFGGRVTILYTIFIVRMIPGLVFIIPYYVIFQKIGIIDTLYGLIIVYITSALPLAIWLFMGFYDEIPQEVFEASIIDGCGEFAMFQRIALPLVVPGVIVSSILVFLGAYNEFGLSLVLLFKESNKTLPLGISGLIQSLKETPFGLLGAAGTIAMIPAILLSLFMQRYFVDGLTAGAVKG